MIETEFWCCAAAAAAGFQRRHAAQRDEAKVADLMAEQLVSAPTPWPLQAGRQYFCYSVS